MHRFGEVRGVLSRDDAVVIMDDVERIEWISGQLGLSPLICQLARLIGMISFPFDALRRCSRAARAAMCVFAASHLLGHRVTLDQLAQVVERTRGSISDAYRLCYPQRYIVNRDSDVISVLREDLEHAWPRRTIYPAWPRPEYADLI